MKHLLIIALSIHISSIWASASSKSTEDASPNESLLLKNTNMITPALIEVQSRIIAHAQLSQEERETWYLDNYLQNPAAAYAVVEKFSLSAASIQAQEGLIKPENIKAAAAQIYEEKLEHFQRISKKYGNKT